MGSSEQGPGRDSECGESSPVLCTGVTAEENDTRQRAKGRESQPCTANRRARCGGNSSESS